MITDEIFEAIEDRAIWLNIHDRTDSTYPCTIVPVTRKSVPTACWMFVKDQHIIQINRECDRIGKLITTEEQRRQFFVKVYEHERCHAEYSPRGQREWADKLKAMGVPFMLWNLFEDARIEHRWRKLNGKFHWMRTVGVSEGPQPQNLFLDLKNIENSRKLTKDWLARDTETRARFEGVGREQSVRQLVRWYFRRAIAAQKTEDLIPLLQSWLKTFPYTEAEFGMMPMAGDVDPDGAAAPEEADGDGDPKPEEEELEAEGKGVPVDGPVEVPPCDYLSKRPLMKLNRERGDRMVRLFAHWLRSGTHRVFSSTPTPHLNMRRYVEGKTKFYRRRADDFEGVKSAVIIYDTSGSMRHAHHEGAYFLYVMNELVRRGLLNCRELILSGGHPFAIKLPMDPRIIEHIDCNGHIEGFAHTMRTYERDLLETDVTLFFTDGHIEDEKIDKAAWHARGVYSIGLYANGDDKSDAVHGRMETMHKYFDSVLARQSIEGVADSLVQLLRPRGGDMNNE
jgi:hypothetical protein